MTQIDVVTHWERKYPEVHDLTVEEVRNLLRRADREGYLSLADAIQEFSCTAQEADAKLRDIAEAGYLEVDLSNFAVLMWRRTIRGNALAGERKVKRITRDRASSIIASVTERCRQINADPDRLHRVTVKLFGSALHEQAESFGDVDISLDFHPRAGLSGGEKERIYGLLRERCNPESMSFLEKLRMAEVQDMKEIKAFIKKGLGALSIMKDDPTVLGASYRWLVNHDPVADKPLTCPDYIVRPNAPPPEEEEARSALPEKTIMAAKYSPVADNRKFPVEELLGISPATAPKLEADLFTPRVGREDGQLTPGDLRNDRAYSLAGFQHLCPVWKDDIDAVEMLRRSLEWCERHKVWIAGMDPFITVSRNHRSNVIRYGLRHPDNFIVTVSSADGFDCELIPWFTRKRASKLDMAGAYAVGFALAKLYREMGCLKMPHFNATILAYKMVDMDAPKEFPNFPALLKEGAFGDGMNIGDGRIVSDVCEFQIVKGFDDE